ncbi:MAG TPA: Pls/PosA family non-ribosomal peptide synthetase [Propionibacteriaceae bacterium]
MNEGRGVDPVSGTEKAFVEVLGGVLQVDKVSVQDSFFDDLGADSMVMAQFCARVRKRDDLPSVSMRDIYQHSTIRRLAAAFEPVASEPAASSSGEGALAEVLAGVMQLDRVAVEDNFFDDLGADSMMMAQFCARVRKRADLPSVSMKDIYQHQTIKSLAAALPGPAPVDPAPVDPAPVKRAPDDPAPGQPAPGGAAGTAVALVAGAALAVHVGSALAVQSGKAAAPALSARRESGSGSPAAGEPAPLASTRQYVVCGILQFLVFLGYCFVYVTVVSQGYLWVSAATGGFHIYLRAVLLAGGTFLTLSILPIVAKWVLVGRWKPQRIQIWSLGYFRFWFVKSLIRSNPLVFIIAGSPLYTLYLRALGARVGKGVAVFSRAVPVCTDLLTIGDGTVILKGASLTCYRAHAGYIETGPVTLGAGVLVSEATVLDIGTSMGDHAQLGHASSLHAGQAVPAGEWWHGSPARRGDTSFRFLEADSLGTLRRVLYSVWQLGALLLVSLPLVIAGAAILLEEVPQLKGLLDAIDLTPVGLAFYVEALGGSFLFMFGGLLLAYLVVVSVPRLLNLALVPDRVYPLYGLHYSLHRTISRLTNVKLFTLLFGDSSYIVHYLRSIGYNLSNVQQTGSNFGTAVAHENPYLSAVGSGTVVADGLSLNNADYSSTSFRVSHTTIGAHNFLGNFVAYPSQGKTGDNCLLATKVMVPVDGPVREGVGLLGSPSFEIPRSVLRDTTLDIGLADEFHRQLSAKNKHNLATLTLALLVRWMNVYVLTMLAMLVADLYRRFGLPALAAELLISMVFTMVFFALVERASRGFRPLRPQYCSIYDLRFWRHERHWKLSLPPVDRLLVGTPFKNVLSRVLGVRLGARVFDDGCGMPEKTLATIGDDCTLNAGSIIQCHSQEDGAFKSDHTVIGSRCTVGVGALVHYGVTMGDGVVLAPDSFLMKGEQVPSGDYWGGNPAGELPDGAVAPGVHPASVLRHAPRRALLSSAGIPVQSTWDGFAVPKRDRDAQPRAHGSDRAEPLPKRALVTTGRRNS